MKAHPKWIMLSLTMGFAMLDQVSKWMAKIYLTPEHPFILLPQVFQLSLTYNTGAAFSLLKNQPLLLTALTSIIFLILLIYGLTRPHTKRGDTLATSLVLGGALGNLLDRFLLGRVTDFLDFTIIHYPVFNLADSFIFCGVLALAWMQLKPEPFGASQIVARQADHSAEKKA